jgi:hypothetical protein
MIDVKSKKSGDKTVFYKTTIKAIEFILDKDKPLEPLDAWNKAIKEFTESDETIKKGCPRVSFIFLADFVYSEKLGYKSKKININTIGKNPRYVLKGFEILNESDSFLKKSILWTTILEEIYKVESAKKDEEVSVFKELNKIMTTNKNGQISVLYAFYDSFGFVDLSIEDSES